MNELSRLELFGLFAYAPKVHLLVSTSSQYVFAIKCGTEARHSTKVLISWLVSAVDDPKQLSTLRKKSPNLAISPARDDALPISHEFHTVTLGKVLLSTLHQFNSQKLLLRLS